MADYSSSEIISMQSDAVRRVNEMQRLARQRVLQTPNDTSLSHSAGTPNATAMSLGAPMKGSHEQPFGGNPKGEFSIDSIGESFTGILDKFNLDEEKILIIILIIILVNEGADIMLVLALGYILLTT